MQNTRRSPPHTIHSIFVFSSSFSIWLSGIGIELSSDSDLLESMERDFMGIGGKELVVEGGLRGTCSSPVHRPLPTKASSLQQFIPFKSPATQDEKLNPIMSDHMPPTGFHPILGFDAHHKMISQKSFTMSKQGPHPYPLQGYPTQVPNRFDLPTNQPNLHLSSDPRMPPVALNGNYFRANNPAIRSNQALPALRQQKTSGGGPGFAAPVFGCANGGFTPRDRNNPLPATAQLTIFYGGYVNVYDNVTLEKAQAIMLMAANGLSMASNASNMRNQELMVANGLSMASNASNMRNQELMAANGWSMASNASNMRNQELKAAKGSSMASNALNVRNQEPVQAPSKVVVPEPAKTSLTAPKTSLTPQKTRAASPRSGFSSPISTVSHSAAHSTSSSSNPDERKGHATTDTWHEPVKVLANEDAPTPSNAPMAKPVPMMRKLSLARFLEKRKERFITLSPYPLNQKPFEGIMPNPLEGTTRPEICNSSGKEWPWHSNTAKNSSDHHKPPNTKLEI